MLVWRLFSAPFLYPSDTLRHGQIRAGMAGLRHKVRHKLAVRFTHADTSLLLIVPYASCMDPDRQAGALLIAACLVAAIRLRGEPIKPSPKLTATISESVQLARMVMREVQRGNA